MYISWLPSKQVTVVEAEVVRGENEDKETRVRFFKFFQVFFLIAVIGFNEYLYEKAFKSIWIYVDFRCRLFATKGKIKILQFKIPLKLTLKLVIFIGLPFRTLVSCFKSILRYIFVLSLLWYFQQLFFVPLLELWGKNVFPSISTLPSYVLHVLLWPQRKLFPL